jgi:DNA-binding response OmpR family regulator
MSRHINHPLRRQVHGILDERRLSAYENAIPPDYLNPASEATLDNSSSSDLTARTLAFPPLSRITIEDLVIDVLGREVQRRGRRIQLTFQEFELLSFLAQNRGRVFTRRELVRHVWSAREYISSRTVDIHVHRLRTKLGTPFDRLIETVRQVGYKLSSERSVDRLLSSTISHAVRKSS